ncbi:MAG: AraC-like DNA-binding protein, partial [Oceanospirillaceae bacterium]
LGVIVDGVQKQKINGTSQLFGPGCISVVPPDQLHDGSTYALADSGDQYTLRTFRISASMIDSYLADIFDLRNVPGFYGALIENSAIAHNLLNLHRLMSQAKLDLQQPVDNKAPFAQLFIEETLIQLLEPLFLKLGGIKPQAINGGLSWRDWLKVREYCHENLHDKIVLTTLADLCGLSKFQFLRHFEITTGLTPRAWLIRLRLERACELMKFKPENLSQIASEVGFYDQSHFNRAFRQAFGVSPSKY